MRIMTIKKLKQLNYLITIKTKRAMDFSFLMDSLSSKSFKGLILLLRFKTGLNQTDSLKTFLNFFKIKLTWTNFA